MAPPRFLVCFLFLSLQALPSPISSSSQFTILPLIHSLSSTQLPPSPPHLLKSSAASSAARFNRRRNRRRQISLPLSSGSDYTLSLSVGNRRRPVSLYMDTGSDLVWFPCAPFSCVLCDSKPPAAPHNLSSSAAAVPCHSPACAAAHSSPSPSDLCAVARCPLPSIETSDCSSFPCPPFYYAYGDGSLVARLVQDSLAVLSATKPQSPPPSSPSPPSELPEPLVLKNFTFGCSHSALGEPIGVAGFGRGALSLPAQLASLSPHLGARFSYCLVSHSFNSDRVRRPSPLILGRAEPETDEKELTRPGDGFVYVPMLTNRKHPYFYSVALDAVSVGETRILAPLILNRVDSLGNGGMVVDSGTTFTMLPSGFHKAIVAELDRRVGPVYKRASGTESRTGLGPCYYLENGTGSAGKVAVPTVALHFGGNSSVVLPRRNYFYEFLDGGDEGKGKRKVGCLMLMDGGDDQEGETSGPGGTLGNYQQQGFEVVYDLEKRRLGFARRRCASLWEELNRS